MYKKYLILMVAIAMLIISPAVASGDTLIVDQQNGYTVTAGTPDKQTDGLRTVFSSITQGQTNWHYKYVSSSTNILNINLDWDNPSNSLSLTIYTADGNILGPYYDSIDGSNDGKISIQITNPNGIEPVKWDYKVYGYRVSGTEDYSI